MKKLCLLLTVLVSCGCAHTSPEQSKRVSATGRPDLSAALVTETIVKGKTTKKEILAKLGAPNSVARNAGRPANQTPAKDGEPAETWNYWTAPPAEALQKSGQIKIFRLTVYFDSKDVALDYRAGESTLNIP